MKLLGSFAWTIYQASPCLTNIFHMPQLLGNEEKREEEAIGCHRNNSNLCHLCASRQERLAAAVWPLSKDPD
jgi:hypothetical protein